MTGQTPTFSKFNVYHNLFSALKDVNNEDDNQTCKHYFFILQVKCILSRKKRIHWLKTNPFHFRFQPSIVLKTRLFRFVNGLKINGFCRSLPDTSVNFRKPPFINRTLPSPTS